MHRHKEAVSVLKVCTQIGDWCGQVGLTAPAEQVIAAQTVSVPNGCGTSQSGKRTAEGRAAKKE